MQLWPACEKPPTRTFAATSATSASGSTISGEVEPSSSFTFFRGAFATMPQPTGALPVNVTRRGISCTTSASPTSPPDPVTTVTQSSGMPASTRIATSAFAESGVADAGLSTTGQPAAIAGASLWATRFSGKLNGLMAATTPIGTRSASPIRPAPEAVAPIGTTSPPEPPSLGGRDRERVDAARRLDPRRPDRLPGLERDRARELLVALAHELGRDLEHADPLVLGPAALERGGRAAARRVHVLRCLRRHDADDRPVEGTANLDLTCRGAGHQSIFAMTCLICV